VDCALFKRIALAGLLILSAAVVLAAGPEDEFLAAREAFRAGNLKKLETHAARLKGHLLEPYAGYWRLRLRLDSAGPDDVLSYIHANNDTPLSDLLRADWLKSLARNQRWEAFDAEFPRLVRDDIELTCYALQSKMRVNPSSARTEARPLWFVARELPESCTPLFNALIAAKQLTDDDLWTRIRLALEIGRVVLAQRTGELLPAGQAPEGKILTAIAANPGGYLERKAFDVKSRAARETAMFAVHRLARTSPQQAAAHWARIEAQFDPDERAYVWGMLGYLGAMRHSPGALDWYARAGGLSDVQLAWKARAALREGNWTEVLAAIAAMTPREAELPSWRYWKARALRATGNVAESEELLKALAGEFNFYGQLALEEMGGRVAPPLAGFKPGADDLRAIGRAPGLQRALTLYRLNLRVEANREWLWAIRHFDDRQLLAAAEFAARHHIYDRAINTADRTVDVHDFSLRYLAPFREVLKTHVSQMDLDEAWVYGLIRQESRFIADVRSHAGASGLMQLMPGTARWVAKKLGLKNWRWSEVNDVQTNVSLGTWYLRHVYDALDGHPVLASAAYNAGPGRARAWRPAGAMEGAIYAETIPFNETRDYVQKVMANAVYYSHVLGQQVLTLKDRLGTIAPRQRDREPSLGDTP
jgi:soluble lytic murein transglycosylase